MRHRNVYGYAGVRAAKTNDRSQHGTRRPVTERGRAVLENSRRKLPPR